MLLARSKNTLVHQLTYASHCRGNEIAWGCCAGWIVAVAGAVEG